jgi:hypothetical protein
MNKSKLIAYGLVILGALSAAAVQTGVGADVVNAVCGQPVTVPAPASVPPVKAAPVDAGLPRN